ncbi:hypothetical protein RRSWK_02785 [Rhodopirellula sp. SWK7]|nr:hypothetical protein RRSWK_02785 [Rhodopirellula sp. SWK7]
MHTTNGFNVGRRATGREANMKCNTSNFFSRSILTVFPGLCSDVAG